MSDNICDSDKQFLIDIAKKIKSKNLNIPSIFFLEMMKPLSFISSQTMIFLDQYLVLLSNQIVIIVLLKSLKIVITLNSY